MFLIKCVCENRVFFLAKETLGNDYIQSSNKASIFETEEEAKIVLSNYGTPNVCECFIVKI